MKEPTSAVYCNPASVKEVTGDFNAEARGIGTKTPKIFSICHLKKASDDVEKELIH